MPLCTRSDVILTFLEKRALERLQEAWSHPAVKRACTRRGPAAAGSAWRLGTRLGPIAASAWSCIHPFIKDLLSTYCIPRLPWGLDGEESTCQCRRPGFDPWVGKIPWRRKWQPRQYSCLENPMDRGAWRATVHGTAKSQARQSKQCFHFHCYVPRPLLCPGDRRWGTTSTISHPLGIYSLAGDTTPQLSKFMVLKSATERGMWYSGRGRGCGNQPGVEEGHLKN